MADPVALSAIRKLIITTYVLQGAPLYRAEHIFDEANALSTHALESAMLPITNYSEAALPDAEAIQFLAIQLLLDKVNSVYERLSQDVAKLGITSTSIEIKRGHSNG
jgi:hypothetical protein